MVRLRSSRADTPEPLMVILRSASTLVEVRPAGNLAVMPASTAVQDVSAPTVKVAVPLALAPLAVQPSATLIT